MEGKIRRFSDLIAWQEAHKLVLLVYKQTRKFPEEEKFCLTNQCRRAVISVTSNIAEGFGRSSAKDKKNFYVMAKTSLAEIMSQFLAARDLRYISFSECEEFEKQSYTVERLLVGLIRSAVDREF